MLMSWWLTTKLDWQIKNIRKNMAQIIRTHSINLVTKIPSFSILLTIIIHHYQKVYQLDVSNVFLHGSKNTMMYMKQPLRFIDSQHNHQVCLLHKAIYGLKQAPCRWFLTFSKFLHTLGFKISNANPSLFSYNKSHIQIYIILYVNDMLVIGNNKMMVQQFIQPLSQKFRIKQLGLANTFPNIQITNSNNGFFLNQQHYALKLVAKARMYQSKLVSNYLLTKSAHSHSNLAQFTDEVLYYILTSSL